MTYKEIMKDFWLQMLAVPDSPAAFKEALEALIEDAQMWLDATEKDQANARKS
jgi:hypothetical protein